ncbi:MAG TPA: CHAT domain-containing tetratricopeptide repeat protein [Terriglobales bacterium]|nr:CHAT domain-containing tetratricopeptide repeat protein [Terriglobales bacterium]
MHGQLVGAQEQAEKARVYFSSRDSQWESRFRLLEAEILIWRGLNQNALSLLETDVPSSLATSDLAIRQFLLRGITYARLGKFNEADDSLNKAQRLSSVSQSSLNGELARARGVVAVQRNLLDGAEMFFRQSLQAGRAEHDDFLESSALLNLGVVSVRKEHFDEAIDWFTKARELSSRLAFRLDEEKSLGNLAYAYYKMGDLDRSLALYQEAEKSANDLKIPIDQVRWQNNLGAVYYELGQYDLAREYYLRALSLAETIHNTEEINDALTTLAFLSVQTGKLNDAAKYSTQAIELCKSSGDRRSELYALLASGQMAASMQENPRAEQIFGEVIQDKKSDLSLRWETMHNLAELYEREHAPRKADQEYRAALNALENARSSLHQEEYRLPFLTNAARVYEDYIHFLVQQGKPKVALQMADYGRAQTLIEGLRLAQNARSFSAGNIDPERIAGKMKAAILFYSLGQRYSYLWAVTADRTAVFQLPASKEIEAAVQRYHHALLGPGDVLEMQNSDGLQLFETLVKPAQKLISSGSRVVVVPDGALNNLNFETLLVPGTKPHYWIEDATLVNASSIRLLAVAPVASAPRNGKLLLIGDPLPPNHAYDQLAEAGSEIKDIARHFPAPSESVYAEAAATPGAYLEHDPAQFSYIHFVAHGTASRLSPLDSSILLSQGSPAEDSYKLYARDIIHHPLRARLVTISACYGSGTRAYTGEGLVGLSWAFLRAGAHSVIGALWAVSDDSTPRLMDRLYDGIETGQSPAQALRAAKLSLLHSDSIFRKPFYWAPFQLYSGL